MDRRPTDCIRCMSVMELDRYNSFKYTRRTCICEPCHLISSRLFPNCVTFQTFWPVKPSLGTTKNCVLFFRNERSRQKYPDIDILSICGYHTVCSFQWMILEFSTFDMYSLRSITTCTAAEVGVGCGDYDRRIPHYYHVLPRFHTHDKQYW